MEKNKISAIDLDYDDETGEVSVISQSSERTNQKAECLSGQCEYAKVQTYELSDKTHDQYGQYEQLFCNYQGKFIQVGFILAHMGMCPLKKWYSPECRYQERQLDYDYQISKKRQFWPEHIREIYHAKNRESNTEQDTQVA
jgi:hypothetical protein